MNRLYIKEKIISMRRGMDGHPGIIQDRIEYAFKKEWHVISVNDIPLDVSTYFDNIEKIRKDNTLNGHVIYSQISDDDCRLITDNLSHIEGDL